MASAVVTARLIFAGMTVVLLMYGIYFTLTVISLHYLLTSGRNRIVLGYTVITLLVTTIFLVASVKYTEVIFIETAIDPVGSATLGSRLDLLQQVVYSVKIWLADSLLIYRLWVIWEGNYAITIVPSILFIGALSSGIAGVSIYHHVNQHPQIVHLGIGFHTCSVALNVIATTLIAGRLLRQRKVVRYLGDGHGRQYLSLLAVFVESGALYSITGLIYIPLYALNSPLIYVFAALLESASGIAPSLILLRIALGVAVKRQETGQIISTMNFGNRKDHTTSHSSELSTFAASSRQTSTMQRNQDIYIEKDSSPERSKGPVNISLED